MSSEHLNNDPKVSSLADLMKEFDQGVMKIPRVFEGKIHEACPTISELVDDKRKRIDRFWNDGYLKTMKTTICHIQEWFSRLSLINKTAFMRKLIQEMADSKQLFNVAYFIGPPLKDMVYARTQFTRSAYDVAAVDHNRSVEDSLHETQSSDYLLWFQALSPHEQFNAFIGLAHLGGGYLQECIYSDIVKILETKERNVIRQRVLEYLANKKKDEYKVVASKVARRKKHKQIRSLYKHSHSKDRHRSKETIEEDEEEADYVVLLKQKIDEFKTALKAMNDIADGNYSETVKDDSKDRIKGHGKMSIKSHQQIRKKKRIRKSNAGLDRFQMLPLWDNRRITAFLPEKIMQTMMNVNKYWKETVEKTKKELKMRKKIDHYFKAPEPHRHLRKVKNEHHKNKHFKTKNSSKAGSVKESKLSKRTKELEDIFEPEDFQDRLDVTQAFPDSQSKLKPFAKNYNVFVVCDKYCDDRVFDATKRWAAYSCKMDVEFTNISLGVDCNIRLEDAQKTKISCLCFHPEGASIFTGAYDGQVKLHDVWKRSVKLVYPGHKGIVEDISANCKYVASCGLDNQIRVFNIADGRCMFCHTLDNHTPCRLVMTQCGDPFLYVGNSFGEMLMFRIRSEDNSKEVGRTIYAHRGEVTSIHHYPCFLLSTGIDCYVRMWTTNFEKPYWIVSLHHPTRVNSAVLSYRRIISACEDGKIRIWDVMQSICERVIPVVMNGRPVLDIICINTPSTVKLVVSSEANIKVLEFPLKKMVKKKVGRTTGSMMKPVADLKKKITSIAPCTSSLDKRMMKLQMRQAVSPPIRPSPDKKSPAHPLLVNVENKSHHTDLQGLPSKNILRERAWKI